MKNKVRFSFSIVLLLILSLSFTSLKTSAQPTTFKEVYQQALELNKDRFEDLDLIQIGDTVYVPSLSGSEIVKKVAKEPDPVTGKRDCIWYISERHSNEKVTPVAAKVPEVKETTPKVLPVSLEEDEAEAGFP